MSAETQPRTAEPSWTLPVLTALAYLVARIPGLLDLPIFCDEAIYLRYAQLVARDPIANAFVSVTDPKPPLHYWLMACVFGTAADPLLPARLLSVAAGLATTLLLFPLCGELYRLAAGPSEREAAAIPAGAARPLALSASLLFVTSPFLAFYQRMALAESLLLLETVLVAWLSLRWARHALGQTLRDSLLRDAIPLGIAMACALLTKQVYSYTLLALPPIAALAVGYGRADRGAKRRLAATFAAAIGLSLLLFLPYAVVSIGPPIPLRDRLFFRASHGDFDTLSQLARLTWDNLRYVFVPMTLKHIYPVRFEGFRAPADAGWLWLYLTPPIYVLSIAGSAWLVLTRRRRQFLFLMSWAFLMLLAVVPFAKIAISRYALFAAAPLLLAAALLLASLLERLGSPSRTTGQAMLARLALIAALFLWPLRSLWLQNARWLEQPLTRADRWEYVSGWPAGGASERAVAALGELASRRPIVVLTSRLPGTPNDVAWVYLEGRPNVSVYFVPWALERSTPILVSPPDDPERLLLFAGFHEPLIQRRHVDIPAETPIFFVSIDPYPTAEGATISSEALLRPYNPQLREIARFSNPPMGLSHAPDSVVIYRIR